MKPRQHLILAAGLFLSFGSWLEVAHAQDNSFKAREVGKGLVSVSRGIYSSGFWIGSSDVVVFDPTSEEFSKLMLGEIRKRTKLPISYVIYSHNHWDHISGAKVFADEGAQIVAHKEAADHIRPNPSVARPTLIWSGDIASLHTAGGDLVLHYVGPSHGKGMTVTEIPAAKAVFVTDLVVAKRVGFMDLPDFDLEGWLNSLNEIEKIDFKVILVAHDFGGGAILGREAVVEQKQFLIDLMAAVGDSFKSGATMETLGDEVKSRMQKYKGWAKFDDWIPLNAMRVALGNGMGW